MQLQSFNGIAQWPARRFISWTVFRGIVACRMPFGSIGKELNQRRALVCARALRRPFSGCVNREKVIAVHAQPWNTVADSLGCERRFFAPGDAVVARDRPLVI